MTRFPILTVTLAVLVATPGLAAAGAGPVVQTGAVPYVVAGPRDGDVEILVAEHGEHGSAYLGVRVEEEIDRPEGGALVEDVVDGSPADEAGLEEGDIIVRFAGKPVHGPRSLTHRIREARPGDRVDVDIVRDGKRETIGVELGERSRPSVYSLDDGTLKLEWDHEQFQDRMRELHEKLKDLELGEVAPRPLAPLAPGHLFYLGNKPKLGVHLVEVTPELREHLGGPGDRGVLVGKIMKGMPAETAGVSVGDLVVGVDGQPIEDAGDLIEALQDLAGKTFRLEVIRDRKPLTLEVFIPAPEEEREEVPGVRA